MHHYTATLLTLALSLSATVHTLGIPKSSASVPAGVKANVSATIDQWLSDIQAVNTFVDTVENCNDPTDISRKASIAFKAAQNEGVSNTILQQDVTLDKSGADAAHALLAQFAIIGPAINDTIFNPENVGKNVAAVNDARCPSKGKVGAIALEGDVQQAAASAVGIKVPEPPLPTACHVSKGAGK